MRILVTILTFLSAMGMWAQDFRNVGAFTDDVTGKTTGGAFLELSLIPERDMLSLKILPDNENTGGKALVDTVWGYGAKYRTEANVETDKYAETNKFFLYDIDEGGRLVSYYVFSQFIDTTRQGVRQIVVRKFDADGKRLWCMAIDTTSKRAKEFFSLLTTARKKLGFKKISAVNDGYDRGKKQNNEYVEPKVQTRTHSIGRGSSYNSGW